MGYDENSAEATRLFTVDSVSASFDSARTEALANLVADRGDWPRLQLALNEHGSWDVVVRVDGGYGLREDAERVLQHFATACGRAEYSEPLPQASGD